MKLLLSFLVVLATVAAALAMPNPDVIPNFPPNGGFAGGYVGANGGGYRVHYGTYSGGLGNFGRYKIF